MNVGEQFSWVMVRTIGLLLVIYSLVPLTTAVGSGYMAYTMRNHTSIVIRSDAKIPEYQRNTPRNRQLQKVQAQLQAAAILNAIFFLLSLLAGLYCLKGGKTVQKILMPPKEAEQGLT